MPLFWIFSIFMLILLFCFMMFIYGNFMNYFYSNKSMQNITKMMWLW